MSASCLLLLTALTITRWADAAELSWGDWLAGVRAGSEHGPVAIYLGARANRLPHLLLNGEIRCHGVPVIVVQAADRVENPFSQRAISGAQLQTILGVGAGTVVFFTREGLPLPQLSMPQAMHGDDPRLFDAYFGFVAGGHDRTMTIAEYCAALGTSAVITQAVARVRHGFSGRPLAAHEIPVAATSEDGQGVIDPWALSGVFYIYARHADDRVFRAQLAEISRAFGSLGPRLTIIVPEHETPDLPRDGGGCDWVLGHATSEALAGLGTSPVMVITARGADGPSGLRLDGFQPAPVLAQLLHLPLTARDDLEHDIPYAEADLAPALVVGTAP